MESATLKLTENTYPAIRGSIPPQAGLSLEPWMASSVLNHSPTLTRYPTALTSPSALPLSNGTLSDGLTYLSPSAISYINSGHIPCFPPGMGIVSNYMEDMTSSNLTSMRLKAHEHAGSLNKYQETAQDEQRR